MGILIVYRILHAIRFNDVNFKRNLCKCTLLKTIRTKCRYILARKNICTFTKTGLKECLSYLMRINQTGIMCFMLQLFILRFCVSGHPICRFLSGIIACVT